MYPNLNVLLYGSPWADGMTICWITESVFCEPIVRDPKVSSSDPNRSATQLNLSIVRGLKSIAILLQSYVKGPKFPSIVPVVIIIVGLYGEKFSNRNVDRELERIYRLV